MPIDYEKRDGVAYITLNNPAKANILDKTTSDAISEAWIDFWEDRSIRCAILTGKDLFFGKHTTFRGAAWSKGNLFVSRDSVLEWVPLSAE